MSAKLVSPVCLLALCAAVHAQQLVRELNPAPTQPFTVGVRQLTSDGQRAFFTAATVDIDEAIYVTDGTAAGTRLFKDLPAGSAGSGTMPFALGFLGSELVFSLQDELWITDPTPTAMTFLGDGLWPGMSQLSPFASIGQVGTRFLFAERGGVGGTRLWVTDGSPQGTQTVAGIGVDRSLVVGGRAFLCALQPGLGWELWTSDGTAAGTNLVVDLVPGGDSHPTAFATLGGVVHFLASLANGDVALWRSNGTAAGTVMIQSFPGFHLGGANAGMVESNGVLQFAVGNALWRSDGTAAGTSLVRGGLAGIENLRTNGSRTWFTAVDASGRELWQTDGTNAGTHQVVDLFPGPGSATYGALADVGGRLFARGVGNGGWNLVVTDGIGAASVIPTPGPLAFAAAELVAIGSLAVFNVGSFQSATGLYVTDGTAAGTGPLFSPGIYRPGVLAAGNGVALGDELLFFANDGSTGRELWRTDGTAANTAQVVDLFPGSGNGIQNTDAEMVAMDGYAYFTTGTVVVGGGQAFRPRLVYRTDGTSAGTVALTQHTTFPNPNSGGYAYGLQVHDHALYFGDTTPNGWRLFRTDGHTPPQQVPEVAMDDALPFLVAGELVYHLRDGRLVWRSDGTANGTFQLSNQSAELLGRLGDDVLFRDSFGVSITDGTLAGTQRIFTAPLGGGTSTAIGMFGGDFYWLQRNLGATVQGLMRSDGTPAGTSVVANFLRAQQAVVGADAIYLIAFDAAGGNELWRSDGTAAGTSRVVDLAPGREPGLMRLSLCGAGNRVFLAATDGVSGLEPWISDGTAAGTVRLIDGNPNGNGNPTFLGVAADRCYFLMDDGVHGIELWAAPVGTTGAAVVQSLGRGCAGAAGVPQLRANGLPLAGASTFGVDLDRVPANSLTVCLFGTQHAPSVLPSGCTIWPAGAQATQFVLAGLGGAASFPLPIPAATALVGVQLAAQAGALDTFGTALPGISLSNALILVVGG